MVNKKELLVFVINVGVSSKDSQSNPVFLDKTKKIVQHLMEKKIFYRPKDEIGLLLYGSTTTLNENNFNNVEEIQNDSQCVIQMPNWDLIQFVSNLQLTDCVSNWIEALYAAIDLIKRESVDDCNKLIVLFSDFKEVPDDIPFDEKEIISKLKDQKIKLIAIGLELLHNITKDTITSSEKLIIDICKQTNGIYRTINEAFNDTRFIKKAQSRLIGWSCDLELLDIKIPIKSYVKVTKEARFPLWELVTDKTSESKTIEPNEPVQAERVREHHGRHRDIHNAENTIRGYNYGGRFIPFSKEDEETMMYKSGPKSYKFICFTKKKRVGMQYWSSSTSNRIVIPANKSATPKFYSLMEAMNKNDFVAIVRKVYRMNSNPNIVALFPRMNIPNEPWCFVEIILPYAENTRVIESKPLTSFVKKLSKEQNDIVDNLLDAFMSNDIRRCTISSNRIRSNAFSISIKQKNAGLLYSMDFSVICLITNAESVHDRPVRKPCCSSANVIRSFISDSSTKKKEKPFMPGCVPSPMRQHKFNMLSYRALNPEKPLPSIDIELKKLLEPSKKIKERLIDPIEKIKKLFDLPDHTTEKIQTFKDPDNTQSQLQPSDTSKNNNSAVDNESFEEMIAPSDVLDVDMDPLINSI
ncbi:PREDICTED: X-ray repair cross-complementing protein 5-like isoform X1 [Polistes dominula]|uniref:X-ray repair cross-complementing protein 5-like isoform X1 n=1 Tax=Polistes dominula TaxID=743375 RepID=A0ABM1I9H2_POLDO|nr:PREDICTED: X-ray repair cross-complementing protein 5-like isoform X1 [Polistes dominula]